MYNTYLLNSGVAVVVNDGGMAPLELFVSDVLIMVIAYIGNKIK